MSAPLTPNTYRTGATLAPRIVNENRLRRAADIDRSYARRYEHSIIVVPLDGLTNASAAGERMIRLSPHLSNRGIEIISAELVIFASDSNTWTLAAALASGTISGWTDVTVTGAGDATQPARSTQAQSVYSASAYVEFSLSCSGASTITAGYMILGVRHDRQVSTALSPTRYSPVLLDATKQDSAADFNTEFTNEETAVARDLAIDADVRQELYLARNISNATAPELTTWRIPASGRRIRYVVARVCAAVGVTATWQLDSPDVTVTTIAVAGVGTSTQAAGTSATLTETQADDPFTSASDYLLTLAVSGGTALLTYCMIQFD